MRSDFSLSKNNVRACETLSAFYRLNRKLWFHYNTLRRTLYSILYTLLYKMRDPATCGYQVSCCVHEAVLPSHKRCQISIECHQLSTLALSSVTVLLLLLRLDYSA